MNLSLRFPATQAAAGLSLAGVHSLARAATTTVTQTDAPRPPNPPFPHPPN
jgi:hypothetical protein